MPKKINVMRLRAKLDLTQAEMADALGVHQTTIHRLELGKQPSKPVQKLLERMAEEAA